MKIILDSEAGTCGGVRRAIELVEEELKSGDREIYVLGDIIHNEREVERLNQAGLKTIQIEDLDNFEPASNERKVSIIIRAHGEPPSTIEKLNKLGVKIVDGTCPVVHRSQRLAAEYNHDNYQIAIVGKHAHPEMIGIIGHTESIANVIQFDEDVDKLTPGKQTLVMAQTTISTRKFKEMIKKIKARVGDVIIRDTICKSVVQRDKRLSIFAKKVDVLLVVGGHKSSNTKELYRTCLTINPHTYHVVTPSEIDYNWLKDVEIVGVTGSASTPRWLLNEFVEALKKQLN
ncbi:4-hydroxy-3-methylbut-2-enyl diphosphate reductase [bacterium]|nr:4-hydroxy-3-methylbut-2-enyl diphosphate reductase [bacterium]